MARDVLAIWIKTFGLVELTETSVDTGIPRLLESGSQLD
jgi:hypothetical protein